MPLEGEAIRAEFPALDSGVVFFDNPAGTQVPRQVIERIQNYMIHTNANQQAAFATSKASDAMIEEARSAVADFFNAQSPREIVFGPNMTSLTMAISRSLARGLEAGDEIIVTRLDHDGNIAPWLLVAEDKGCKVRWVDIDLEDCTLKMDQFESFLNDRTRIVAAGYASNAVGTINPIRRIVELTHAAGALCYVDAVQYAPHGSIDVQAIDCDFLVASAYKFFGPHAGVLYGKYEHLDRLRAYKVRPAPEIPPEKFEIGTGNFEGIAGVLGAIEYLARVGRTYGPQIALCDEQASVEPRMYLRQAMTAIQAREKELAARLLRTLSGIPGLRVYGIADMERLDQRVPTFSITLEGYSPRGVAERLAEQGIYVRDGHYYALALVERLGLLDRGGMVRIGLVHYNTPAEIDRLGNALSGMVA